MVKTRMAPTSTKFQPTADGYVYYILRRREIIDNRRALGKMPSSQVKSSRVDYPSSDAMDCLIFFAFFSLFSSRCGQFCLMPVLCCRFPAFGFPLSLCVALLLLSLIAPPLPLLSPIRTRSAISLFRCFHPKTIIPRCNSTQLNSTQQNASTVEAAAFSSNAAFGNPSSPAVSPARVAAPMSPMSPKPSPLGDGASPGRSPPWASGGGGGGRGGNLKTFSYGDKRRQHRGGLLASPGASGGGGAGGFTGSPASPASPHRSKAGRQVRP